MNNEQDSLQSSSRTGLNENNGKVQQAQTQPGTTGKRDGKDDLEVHFLYQGAQTAEQIATMIADYVRHATQTIDLAAYSFSLCPEPKKILLDALTERQNAGVKIRIAYDAGSQKEMITDPANDRCDLSTPEFVSTLGFPAAAIEGFHALMHDKYIVLDAALPSGQVWTGSMNFSDDAFTLQESNIIILRSQEIAALYANDFEELWVDHKLESSGHMDSGEATLEYKGERADVLVNFAPSEGEWIDEMLARQIERTTHRMSLAAVVLTSGRIIEAIQGLMQRGVPIDGVYDATQMEGVKYQWQQVPDNHWKIPAFEEIVRYGNLVGKHSTPYTDKSKHDFMHNKVMVLDDVVVTGSYNFSRHAQQNAENCLLIKSAPLAGEYRDHIARVAAMYAGQQAAPPPKGAPVPPEETERKGPTQGE